MPSELPFTIDLGLPPGTHRVHAVMAKGLSASGEVFVPDGDPNGPPIAVSLPLR